MVDGDLVAEIAEEALGLLEVLVLLAHVDTIETRSIHSSALSTSSFCSS